MVMGDIRWDRKEFPESNLHVYNRDDAKIVVYSIERCTKKGRRENQGILIIRR